MRVYVDLMSRFSLRSDFEPRGDQPAAIASLVRGLEEGRALVAAAFPPEEFAPRQTAAWEAAEERFGALRSIGS